MAGEKPEVRPEGPTVTIARSCDGCRYEQSEGYKVQGDSGHDVYCTHPQWADQKKARRHVGDTRWTTPEWCPVLAAPAPAPAPPTPSPVGPAVGERWTNTVLGNVTITGLRIEVEYDWNGPHGVERGEIPLSSFTQPDTRWRRLAEHTAQAATIADQRAELQAAGFAADAARACMAALKERLADLESEHAAVCQAAKDWADGAAKLQERLSRTEIALEVATIELHVALRHDVPLACCPNCASLTPGTGKPKETE